MMKEAGDLSELAASPQPDPVMPAATEEGASADDVSVARATGVIALGNIASRLLGLGREMLLSDLFGAGAAVDAFNMAVIVPKTLYDLLIGGHVNSALVPILSEYTLLRDRNRLWRLVNLLLGGVVCGLAILVLLLELLAPQIIALVSGGDFRLLLVATNLPPADVLRLMSGGALLETQRLATELLRITTPALFFLSLFAVLSGLLYSLQRFTLPAFAGALFNASIVLVTVIGAPALGITAMAVGWLVGAVVQMVTQLWGVRDARLWPTLNGFWQEPGLHRIGRLYIPVMLSLVVDTLVIRLVSYRLAAHAGEASISYMNYATTLIQFPHGLVATAISVAILPTLSRQASQAETAGESVYKDTLGRGLRLAIVLIVPATIGLFILATSIVDLIFGHGSFTLVDTAVTALALRLYLFGLPFATVDLLLVFAFYSRQDTLTPALVGLISLAAYMAVALGLMPQYGLFSLMIADSVKHLLHALIAAWLLSRRIGGLGQLALPVTTLKTIAASLIMGVATLLAMDVLMQVVAIDTLLGEIILVVGAGGIGFLAYGVMAALFGINEFYWLIGLLRHRLRL